jgi:hypothetical protein
MASLSLSQGATVAQIGLPNHFSLYRSLSFVQYKKTANPGNENPAAAIQDGEMDFETLLR